MKSSVVRTAIGLGIFAALLVTATASSTEPSKVDLPCKASADEKSALRVCSQVLPKVKKVATQKVGRSIQSYYKGQGARSLASAHVPGATPVCNPVVAEIEKNHLGESCGTYSEVGPGELDVQPDSAEVALFRGAVVQAIQRYLALAFAEIDSGSLTVHPKCAKVVENYQALAKTVSEASAKTGVESTPELDAAVKKLEKNFTNLTVCSAKARGLDRVKQAYFTPEGKERFKAVVDKHVIGPCKKTCKAKCATATDKTKCGSECGTNCWARKYPQIFKIDLTKVLP